MTPLSQILPRIGWTVPELARRVGVSAEWAYRWHAGKNARGNPCETPADVLAWLTKVEQAIAKTTPPTRKPV